MTIHMGKRKKERLSALILDSFDIFCLVEMHHAFIESKECTMSSIIKSFFKEEYLKNTNYYRFISDKMNFIRPRLQNMESEGIIIVKKNEKNIKLFELNYKKVCLKKTICPDKKKIDSLWIKDKENRWIMFQII